MKKILSLLLAVIMIIGMMPASIFASEAQGIKSLENEKNYEEAMIDGQPYKVYKLADLLQNAPQKNNSLINRRTKRDLQIFRAEPEKAEPTDEIKFKLDFVWETYDRPVKDVILPVFVGPPNNKKSIKLGYFKVNSKATQEQRFEMVEEYHGTNPSIKHLVNKAYGQIIIAIPEDMRYDFILASAKWDSKQKYGTTGIDLQVIFRIEARQSVMHGYGIKWYDTDKNNRQPIKAKWMGKDDQNIESDLATEDRNYSAYIRNKIDENNYKTYADGSQYTEYEYYYNGNKITTIADKDHEGRYSDVDLAINGPIDSPNAGLYVDGNRSGEKILNNDTKYFYDSVGDYRTFHVLSMREALKVKFNTGKGSLVKDGPVKQQIGEDQEIGHSEKISGNESKRTITIPDGSKLIPPAKESGQFTDNEFVGWNTDENAKKGLNLDEFVFKDKPTVFYAIYAPKAAGKANIRYVVSDNANNKTPIDNNFRADEAKNYPSTIEGTLNSRVLDYADNTKNPDFKAPKFVGYKYIKASVDGANQNFTDPATATLDLVYEKIDDIVPGKEEKPAGYVTVTFKDVDGAKVADKDADVIYYVNPKANVTITKDGEAYNLVGKKANEDEQKQAVPVVTADTGYKVVENPDKSKWAYKPVAPKDAITSDTEFTANVEILGNKTAPVKYYAGDEELDIKDLKVEGQTYPETVQGQEGSAIVAPTEQPQLVGYKFVSATIEPAGATFGTQNAYVKLNYTKIDDIVPGTEDKPAGYVTVTFKDVDGAKVADKDADVIYYVNPKANVTITKDGEAYNLIGKKANEDEQKQAVPVVSADTGYKVVEKPEGWGYTPEVSKEAITKDITYTANVGQPNLSYSVKTVVVGNSEISVPTVAYLPEGAKYRISDKFNDPADTKFSINPENGYVTIVTTLRTKLGSISVPVEVYVEKDGKEEVVKTTEAVFNVIDILPDKSARPIIDSVLDTDEYITGKGIPGAEIIVTFPDGKTERTTVNEYGEWEVEVPGYLEEGDRIEARQIEPGKEISDPDIAIVRYDEWFDYDRHDRRDDRKEEEKQQPKKQEIKKVWTPSGLNANDHYSYIKGYDNGTFGPQKQITRAEVAMIFARLSTNKSTAGAPVFKDVKAGDWYKKAIDIIAAKGIVNGYKDGTFRPNQPITRREFAAIAARFAGNIDAWKTFKDVPPTDWAYKFINKVAGLGWINGYEDGKFRPNNNITRAEVVAIVNRMLNRKADTRFVDSMSKNSLTSFSDNVKGSWYYYDIYEAALGHDYRREFDGTTETWYRLNGKAFGLNY